MAADAPRRSSAPILSCGRLNRQCSAHITPSSSSFASSALTSQRSFRGPSSSPSPVFSIDRTGLQNRSISMTKTGEKPAYGRKKTCMCSPTNHPGSFRCSLHKSVTNKPQTASYGSSSRLNMRRSAMKNSLVRIGTVEGEWVKRALAALIRPSSHQQRRRGEFRPRPSRLSAVASES